MGADVEVREAHTHIGTYRESEQQFISRQFVMLQPLAYRDAGKRYARIVRIGDELEVKTIAEIPTDKDDERIAADAFIK
jgi:hypothetical protein